MAIQSLNLQKTTPQPETRFALLNNTSHEIDPAIEPIVMETHGGYGKLFLSVYRDIRAGCVFEINDIKASVLADQRPTWAVYQADCEKAVKIGAGGHLPINILDVDPYGSPWEVIDAFFTSERIRTTRLVVVVNDGLRRNLRFGMAWKVNAIRSIIEHVGNESAFSNYLEICRDLMVEKASKAGYSLERFTGYYCGEKDNMTHYLGVFTLPLPYADRT